ncbi:MAG: uracil-DNA glycosylase [Pseudomonadota bacterium]
MMSNVEHLSATELDALLRFYADAGADEVMGVEPVDRFAAKETASKPAPQRTISSSPPSPVLAQKAAVVPDQSVADAATHLAAQANDLERLRDALSGFDGCNLKATARNLAFEGGRRDADIMIVGGAATRDDDANGVPFSGPDGVLLKNMFAAIDLDIVDQTYQALCVPWAPPGGGPPTPIHLNILKPFIIRQIELAAPKHLIIMGNVAAKHLIDPKRMILKLRGQNFDLSFGDWNGIALVMHEPSYLREQPSAKRVTWHDLLAFKKQLTPG